MVIAKIFKNQDGHMTGFDIVGHANSAPQGYDIYCAGISVLSQSVCLTLIKHTKCKVIDDNGKLFCSISTVDTYTDSAMTVLKIGLEEISKLTNKISLSYEIR